MSYIRATDSVLTGWYVYQHCDTDEMFFDWMGKTRCRKCGGHDCVLSLDVQEAKRLREALDDYIRDREKEG